MTVRSPQEDFDALAAARAVLPVLQTTSARSERARRVDDAAIAALRDAGLSRLLAPARFGGYELPVSAHIRSCTVLAHGCSAAGWVHMVCGAHTYVVGRYPERCQREVFGDDPDVLIPGTLAPQGLARRVDGGWALEGRWQFGSGVDHGPWLLVGARAVAEDGETPLPPVHLVLPADDIEVDDTWYTLGMRGTGSQDLVAGGTFVPEHRSMPTRELFRGDFAGDAGALYRLPVLGGLSSMLAGAVLGMAETGLERFIEVTRARKDAYDGGRKAERAGIQLRVAEALGEVELAEMLVDRNCERLDRAMAANRPPLDTETALAIRWNAAYAVELCRRATERIYAAAGANAAYDSSPLERWYRDVNTACHHAIADFDGIREARGRVALGLRAGAPV